MRFYRECIRRQLYLNGPGKTHLSKNPTFTGRVESLIEFFPDARFVVPYRNPLETIPSLLQLMRGFWTLRGVDEATMQRGFEQLYEQSLHSYAYPDQVLARHPDRPVFRIDYRELVAHPRVVVERLYDAFGYDLPPALRTELDAAQARAGRHETMHRYSLDQFGLDALEIRGRLAPLFERFDWLGEATSDAPAEGSASSGLDLHQTR
jgi:hypothetical protein